MRLACVLLATLPTLGLVLGPSTPLGPRAAEAATVTQHSLMHQGRMRTYRLMVPKGHTKAKPVPLVIALHGGGGTAQGFDRSTNGQFQREADKRGWVVVFPQGIAKGWNDGRPLTSLRDRQRRGVDDVAFIDKLIDRLHDRLGIDTTRVYATGISNGGFMSFRLALELSARIAAVAPVTANLQVVHAKKTPQRPVGLFVINGTEDPLVPYAGGHVEVFGRKRGAILSTDATIARWVELSACEGEPTRTALPDRDPNDGTKATLTRHATCRGVEVVLCRVEGGGHTWPGGRPYLPARIIGRVCRDFDAVPLMFDFFARHRRAPAKPAAQRKAGEAAEADK